MQDLARFDAALRGGEDLQASPTATLCPSTASPSSSAAEGPSPLPVVRPRVRGECGAVPRPCPFHACRFSLGEGTPANASCALDLADRGGLTLDELAEVLHVDREKVRQIEEAGLRKVLRALPREWAEHVPGEEKTDRSPWEVSRA